MQAEAKAAARGAGGGGRMMAVVSPFNPNNDRAEKASAKEEAAARLRQDFMSRQHQARANRLKAEGDLFGENYGAGRGRPQQQQQEQQLQLPMSPPLEGSPYQQQQQQRNDLRPPSKAPPVGKSVSRIVLRS